MLMRRYITIIIAGLMLALSACGAPSASTGAPAGNGAIQVQSAWARPVVVAGITATPPSSMSDEHAGHGAMMATSMAMDTMAGMDHAGGPTSAVYMTIVNTGSTADQLVNITTDVAEAAELHITIIENNVGQMRPVPAVDVPAKGQVELRSGSYHVMLIDVKRTLAPGDTVPLTLTFQNAGEIQVTAEVRES